MNFEQIIQTIQNFSKNFISIGIIIVIIFLTVVYILFLNREKILSILFATYTSFALLYFFPYHKLAGKIFVGSLDEFKIILFFVSILIFSLIFILSGSFKIQDSSFFIFKWIKSFLFAISQLALLAVIMVDLISVKNNWLISSDTIDFLRNETFKFICFLLPIIVLLLTKKSRHRGPGRPSLG